jgi:hypothetical protein
MNYAFVDGHVKWYKSTVGGGGGGYHSSDKVWCGRATLANSGGDPTFNPEP